MPSHRFKGIARFTLFNLTLAFFPLTTLLSSNPHILRQPVTHELRLLLYLFLAVFILNEISFLIFRKWRWPILFYFSMLLLFAWDLILEAIGNRGLIGVTAYSILVVSLFLLAVRLSRSRRFEHIMATMLIAFAAIPAVRISLLVAQGGRHPASELSGDTALSKHRLPTPRSSPNFYLLVFDTMASTRQFLDNIDDSEGSRRQIQEFQERMHLLGYHHFTPAWSNYTRTATSMTSFFNFDYHDADIEWNSKYYGFTASSMLDFFASAGYRIVASQKDAPCPKVFDYCYPTVNQLELVSMLAATTPVLYLSQRLDKYLFTPLQSNALRKVAAKLTTTKLSEVDQFIDYIDNKPPTKQPEFTYAHFFATHPINFYDQDCNTQSIGLFEQRSGEDLRSAFSFTRYGAEYLCFLKRIVDVAQAIHHTDPEGWVFITSDHGYGFQSYGMAPEAPWDKTRLDATFRVINLAKTSQRCQEQLTAQKSSVNKARGIVNCLSGAGTLPYLPEMVDLRFVGPDLQLTIDEHGYGHGSASQESD